MTIEVSPVDVEQLLHGILVPTPPQVIADLQMELAMPDPDLNALAELISKDAGLSGGVLKTVNSPFYGLARKMDSINEAVAYLGFESVVNVVNVLSLRSELITSDLNEETAQFMNRFWDSCSDIAMVASITARYIKYEAPDQAYMLGLFHNAGIPLLIHRFDSYVSVVQQAYASTKQRIVDHENRALGTNHSVVGYYVAKSWKLPQTLCNAIAMHHSLSEVFVDGAGQSDEFKDLLAILKIAEHVAGFYRVVGGQSLEHEWAAFGPNVLEYLGMTEHDVDDITAQAQEAGVGIHSYYV